MIKVNDKYFEDYISEKEFKALYDDSFNLMNMMVAFKAKIK